MKIIENRCFREVNLTQLDRIELLPLNVARTLTPLGLKSDQAPQLLPKATKIKMI